MNNSKLNTLPLKEDFETVGMFYSQDLVNNLFKHPYTKIEFIESDLKVSRLTAVRYLNSLVKVIPSPNLHSV